jgi:hypothetical protein
VPLPISLILFTDFEVVARLGLLGIATPIVFVFDAWNKTQLAQFYCT